MKKLSNLTVNNDRGNQQQQQKRTLTNLLQHYNVICSVDNSYMCMRYIFCFVLLPIHIIFLPVYSIITYLLLCFHLCQTLL